MTRIDWMKAAAAGALVLLVAACTTGEATNGSPTAATAASSKPRPAAIDGPPITLSLAVSDADDRPSRPAVDDLVREVAERSGGKITIVPTYRAGDPKFEQGVVEKVLRGQADLGLASARAWDLEGETAFQALMAPFVIDNDALADAVASSDVSREALDGLRGAVGLAMWPEDLRLLSFFEPCGRDVRDPARMQGATYLVQPSGVANRLLTTLGATVYPVLEADRNLDAASCKLQGMEAGLATLQAIPMGAHPVAYGDLVVFPKFQVLAAGAQTHAALSDAQQGVLEDAVAAVAAAATGRHAKAPELATAFCAAGGQVRTAGDAARRAWEAAVRPVDDALEADPFTASLLVKVKALKASTDPSPGFDPCGPPPATQPTPVPVEDIDTTGYSGAMLPNGTFRRELVAEDLIAAGLDPDLARGNEQVLTYVFEDGKATFHWQAKNNRGTCVGTYRSVDGKYVELKDTAGDPYCGVGPSLVWRGEADGGISMIALDPTFLPSDHILLDHWVWTRIK